MVGLVQQGQAIVVGVVVSTDGDAEGQLIDQVQAGEHGRLAVHVLIMTHDLLAGGAVSGLRDGHGRGHQQGEGHVVLSGDLSAIAEVQIVVELDGIGQSTILVADRVVLSHNVLVPHPQAVLIIASDCVSVDQGHDGGIRVSRGPLAQAQVTGDLRGDAVNQTAGITSRIGIAGIAAVVGSVVCGVAGVVATAGHDTHGHDQRQKQCYCFFHVVLQFQIFI